MLSHLQDLVEKACQAGADEADAVAIQGKSSRVGSRFYEIENCHIAESFSVSLRVIVDKKQAVISGNQISSTIIQDMVEEVLVRVRALPQDVYCGLAESSQITQDLKPVESFDDHNLSMAQMSERVLEGEKAALSIPGVTNSHGVKMSWAKEQLFLVASNGFHGTNSSSFFRFIAGVVAGEGRNMQQDYSFSNSVFLEDLEDAAVIGKAAGIQAVRRLNPKKIQTCQVPVLFDSRVSPFLLQHFVDAIKGSLITRNGSFLQDAKGQAIFPKDITIVDDPFRKRGFASCGFDGEGLKRSRQYIVEKGVLKTWLLNLSSARKLQLSPTGHATVALGGGPQVSPTNLYIEPGKLTVEDLIAKVSKGLLVTDVMGRGVNLLTGDYSVGASGFWIEGGNVAYPVNELTIAGNLKDAFSTLVVANDLKFWGALSAPTLMVEGLTVAGR